jgi:hypothetical protein
MKIPLIVIIEDNVVHEIKESTKEKCEEDFIGVCAQKISNWDDYTGQDVTTVLDNGYERFGNGSICLTWIDIPVELKLMVNRQTLTSSDFMPVKVELKK